MELSRDRVGFQVDFAFFIILDEFAAIAFQLHDFVVVMVVDINFFVVE